MWFNLRDVLFVVTCGTILSLASPAGKAQSSTELSQVKGSLLNDSVSPGRARQYRLPLASLHFVQLLIEPYNCDLNVRVSQRDRDAGRVLQTPYGTRDHILLYFLATHAETVRLVVSTQKGVQSSASYRVEVVESRVAKRDDERLIKAQNNFIDAELLKETTKPNKELALMKLRQAANIFEQVGDLDGRGECLREIGRILVDLNEGEHALEVLNEALSLSLSRKNRADEARTRNLLAEAEFNLGQMGHAQDNFTRAASLRESLGDVRGQAQSLNDLAVVLGQTGERAKALAILERVLPMRRSTGSRRGELETLVNLVDAYKVSGEITKALDTLQKVTELLPSFDDPQLKADTLLNVGGLYSAVGEKGKALDSYLDALSFAKLAGYRQTEGILRNNLANLYLNMGMLDRSMEYAKQSLSIATAARDLRQEARSMEMMAAINRTLDRRKTAFDLYTRSLSMCISSKDREWEVLNLNGLGQIQEEVGNLPKALKLFEESLMRVREIGRLEMEALALANIADVKAAMKRFTEAGRYYEESIGIAHKIGDHLRERQFLARFAHTNYVAGNSLKARDLIDEALALAEPLRERMSDEELRSSYFASVQDLYSLKISILMDLHKSQPLSGFDALAFEASETSRARGLLDRLALRGFIQEGLDATLNVREQNLAFSLSGDTDRLLLLRARNSPKSAVEMAHLQKKIALDDAEYQELKAEIQRRNPRFFDLAFPKTLDVENIRKQVLDSESVLLEYSLGETSSTLWVVGSQQFYSFVLPKRSVIDRAARLYYERLTARNRFAKVTDIKWSKVIDEDRAGQTVGRELSEILLTPAAANIEGKRLLIVADGFLNYIPFAALPDPETHEKGEPLAGQHQIVMLPSASVLALSRNNFKTFVQPKKTVAILADPVFSREDSRVRPKADPAKPTNAQSSRADRDIWRMAENRSIRSGGSVGLGRLPFTRQEAESIYGLSNPSEALMALDFGANRDLVLGGALRDYRVIHFATHGFLDDANPAWSGLALSLVDEHGKPIEGFLKMRDIYNLHLNAELVVLSACQTALGKNVKGEGIEGLSRGFMYAGSRRVIASLWEVSDSATAALMKTFYRKLLTDHLLPAEALRSAQAEMAKKKAPFFWAGFVLQGEPN